MDSSWLKVISNWKAQKNNINPKKENQKAKTVVKIKRLASARINKGSKWLFRIHWFKRIYRSSLEMLKP